MIYLLDTCVISDFIKGDQNVMSRLKATSPKQIAISSVTKMEIEYGLSLNPSRAKQLRPILDALLNNIQQLPYNENDAIASANIRAQLKQLEMPIGAYDLMIGGCALNRKLIMVTSNTKKFNRITGLTLENWKLK